MNIIKKLSSEFNLATWQAENATKLIDEGKTVPFIARYRKEATGEMSDEVSTKGLNIYVTLKNER